MSNVNDYTLGSPKTPASITLLGVRMTSVNNREIAHEGKLKVLSDLQLVIHQTIEWLFVNLIHMNEQILNTS